MENNIALTGDEARAIMLAMANTSVSVPMFITVSLWGRLNEINLASPAPQPEEETKNE